MGADATQERHQAHTLVDLLPVDKLEAVVHLLRVMTHPLERSLANAPVDDEPLTAEEIKALDASREWLKHHPGIPHEEVLAELGITQEEIERYNKAR